MPSTSWFDGGSSNYQLRSARVGIKVDVTNVAEILELLDER